MLTHEKDIEYFWEYPAPIMQAIHEKHFTNINSTITFFGPMLYFLLRELGAEKVLEIGHAEGYTAHYLAHAVNDNGIRFGMKDNKYYGIDIVQTEKVRSALEAEKLPVDVRNVDSATLSPETFPGLLFDVIFQDGNHDTEHVLHEIKTMYPQLKGEGKGYWIMHDVFGPAEEGFHAVKNLIKPRDVRPSDFYSERNGDGKLLKQIEEAIFDFEFVRIFSCYGLAIFRKMEGWDESKRHWRD